VAEPRTLNKSLSILVHGESKAGKSLLGISGAAPRVLLDVESAAHLLPIKSIIWDPSLPPPEPDGTWDTAVVQVNDWKDAVNAIEALHSRPHPFKSLSVDSISELQNKCIDSIAGLNQVKLQDWGTALRLMRAFCNKVRDLTKHPRHPLSSVVVTSMSKRNEDTKVWEPYLQGQMKSVLPYLFDVNSFLIKSDVVEQGNWVTVRDLYTEPSGTAPVKFTAGSRISGRVPNPLRLDVITGDSLEAISKANTTVRRIVQAAFSMSLGTMSKPEVRPAIQLIPDAANTDEGVSA
jgi:hypothetical protein